MSIYSYFCKTSWDASVWETLYPELPSRIVDAHVHMNLPEHVQSIPAEVIARDWAVECGHQMSYEDASYYYSALFPAKEINYVAMPWPLAQANISDNNSYISKLVGNGKVCGLYTPKPEESQDSVESKFLQGGFSGFKPYPYLATDVKGADISIFDFMTHAHWEVANRHSAPVLLHLPRAGRLPDKDNLHELQTILERYTNVKPVIAHLGRCFNHEYLEKAIETLGEAAKHLWFDTAAVINPKVYEIAFRHLDCSRILFGTDIPIMLWHGKREWSNGTYRNLCREDFSWNRHPYPLQENEYTFIVYEQLRSILDVASGDHALLNAIFCDNANSIYALQPTVI